MPALVHQVPRPILAGASAAAKVGTGGMLARMAPFTHLFRHAFEIEALASVALDPNPGYRPAVIAAEAAAAGLGPHIRLLMIHDPEGVLRAFAPMRLPSLGERIAGVPRALTMTDLADATPLIDGAEPAAAAALVEALSGFGGARFDGIAETGRTAACLVEAAQGLDGVKTHVWPERERLVLDCAVLKSVRARLDPDYRAGLKSARAALTDRFGRLRLEKIVAEPQLPRALARLRGMVGGRSAIGADCLDTLARAQSDEMCLCLHRLKAGPTEIGMALGLVGAGAWWALAVGFDSALDAPTAPPVMAAMLADSLARDPQFRRAVGGADVATPAWQSEPTVGLAVGPAMKLDAIRALSGLGTLMARGPDH